MGNTTYGVVSKDANGLDPQLINTNKEFITQNFYLLASTDGENTPSWYKLPINAFTWRTIKVGGVSIGNKTLNFMPTGDIYVKTAD